MTVVFAVPTASYTVVAATSGRTPSIAVQSHLPLLVEEVQGRAAASWHRLQVAPEDLVRVAGSWSAAWQSGDGLRAVIYGLILLLIGGGVEWLYWCYAGRARRAIAEAAMAGSDDAALAPRRAAALSGRRALLEASGCALFALSTVAASLIFIWPAGVQEAVLSLTLIVVATRLTGIAVRPLVAPDCPRLRLLPTGDATARRVRRIAVGLAAFVVGGSSLSGLCDGLLAAPSLGFALGLVAAFGICGFELDGIRLWSSRLNSGKRRRRVVPAASIVLPFLGTVAAVAGVVFTLLGVPQLAMVITIGFAAFVAERTIRALIDIFTAEPVSETQADAAGGPAAAYRPVLRRMALLIVIGVALIALAAEWGVSIQDLWQSEGVGRRLGRGLEVTIVVLLGDLAWLWARTAIDRHLVVLGARTLETRSGEPSDPRTRWRLCIPCYARPC
jgi:hypothetical protein